MRQFCECRSIVLCSDANSKAVAGSSTELETLYMSVVSKDQGCAEVMLQSLRTRSKNIQVSSRCCRYVKIMLRLVYEINREMLADEIDARMVQ